MNDFEVMRRARLKWVRELGLAGRPMPTEQALAAYHRGFIDALETAHEAAARAFEAEHREYWSPEIAEKLRAMRLAAAANGEKK